MAPTTPALSATSNTWSDKFAPLATPWTGEVSPTNALPDYPRPQLARPSVAKPTWQSLNGLWEYQTIAMTVLAARRAPSERPVWRCSCGPACRRRLADSLSGTVRRVGMVESLQDSSTGYGPGNPSWELFGTVPDAGWRM